MGEEVSQIENAEIEKSAEAAQVDVDLFKEFRIQYRLIRKKCTLFLREKLKKNFVNILYITTEEAPKEFIIALQKQYPDKVVKVIKPIFEQPKNTEKLIMKFDYFLQNNVHSAFVYNIPAEKDNIQVYGIYSDVFSNIESRDIYNIKYISHYAKIVRKAALKIKPDIIHADNVPLLMGLELEGRWITGYPVKYIQILHSYNMYNNIEPFWAALNLANKKEMKKIFADNIIQNCLAAIFNAELSKMPKKINSYVNYIFDKYDEYRKNVGIEEHTRENVLLRRMDERILKIFPKMSYNNKHLYNPADFSMKYAAFAGVNSISCDKQTVSEYDGNIIPLPVKCNLQKKEKIHNLFTVNDFRETRFLNKKYLVRELSEKRIEMKFYDISLFKDDEVNIRGYLDSFYQAPLFLVLFNEYAKEQDIKTVSLTILKAFEQRKNIQVIYNFPKILKNSYLNSLLDFFESQPALNGKWISVEGDINKSQFLSSADMILIPSGNCLKTEINLYEALSYGCIPVISKENFGTDIVQDIFDDMNSGCVFMNCGHADDKNTEYESIFLKAIEYYTNNQKSWSLITENAMKYDSSWDFKSIEEYNNLYEEII